METLPRKVLNRLPIKCNIERALVIAEQIDSGELHPDVASIKDLKDIASALIAFNKTYNVLASVYTFLTGVQLK